MEAKKKKVFTISLYLHDLEGGGAERSMVMIANGLFKYGYSVEVILNQLAGVYFDELNSSIKVISLDSSKRISHILKLRKHLKKERPRVLISTNVAPNYWAIIANLTSGRHSKHILREANTPHIEFKESNPRRKLGLSLARLLYRFADACVGNSADSVKSIQRFYRLNKAKVYLIYNGIPTDNIRSMAQTAVSHKWVDRSGIKLIITVGRVVDQKNHKMLIKALSYVNEHDKNYRLIILGSRGLEKKYEREVDRLIAEHGLTGQVDFIGFTPNPFTYMSKADLFILSSKWEGFPSVLAQSMACGTPVISTDCLGAAREILANGEFGTLVPVDDWRAMGEAILNIDKAKTHPQSLIKRAHEFSVEGNINSYNQLIKKMIDIE